MSCFLCNEYGHWARNCPSVSVTCKFCGDTGHSHNACELQKRMKPSIEVADEPISRTRTRKGFKTFDTILFENHLTNSKNMKKDIDDFVKATCSTKGFVDDSKLCDTIFGGQYVYNFTDEGHLRVLGYIISKYCEVSNPILKKFLRDMHAYLSLYEYSTMLRRFLGIIIVTSSKTDAINFRKHVGEYC